MNLHPLETGFYSLAEAARLAEVSSTGIRWWFKDRPDRNVSPLLSTGFPTLTGDYTINFLGLIEMRMVSKLRSLGLGMPTIRKAYRHMARRMRTSHPFAHTNIYTDGADIFVHAAHDLEDDELSEAVSRQLLFPRVREFLTQIDYSERTGLARRWNIARGVILDPTIRRGKPVVRGTGLATFVLANCYFANGEKLSIPADLFEVSTDQVRDAVAFEERYGLAKAA